MVSMYFLSLNRVAQRFDFTDEQPEPGVNSASVGGPAPRPCAAAATRSAYRRILALLRPVPANAAVLES